MSDVFKEIVRLFRLYGGKEYMIQEAITQEQHALQTFMKMKELTKDHYLWVAALLHDIGHFLTYDDTNFGGPLDPAEGVDDHHEEVGADWLRCNGFSPRVFIPVSKHVDAKRYLCAVKPYPLSHASTLSLQLQGGPMKPQEQRSFEESPYFRSAILLRLCDDRGKNISVNSLPTLESLEDLVISTIDQRWTSRMHTKNTPRK